MDPIAAKIPRSMAGLEATEQKPSLPLEILEALPVGPKTWRHLFVVTECVARRASRLTPPLPPGSTTARQSFLRDRLEEARMRGMRNLQALGMHPICPVTTSRACGEFQSADLKYINARPWVGTTGSRLQLYAHFIMKAKTSEAVDVRHRAVEGALTQAYMACLRRWKVLFRNDSTMQAQVNFLTARLGFPAHQIPDDAEVRSRMMESSWATQKDMLSAILEGCGPGRASPDLLRPFMRIPQLRAGFCAMALLHSRAPRFARYEGHLGQIRCNLRQDLAQNESSLRRDYAALFALVLQDESFWPNRFLTQPSERPGAYDLASEAIELAGELRGPYAMQRLIRLVERLDSSGDILGQSALQHLRRQLAHQLETQPEAADLLLEALFHRLLRARPVFSLKEGFGQICTPLLPPQVQAILRASNHLRFCLCNAMDGAFFAPGDAEALPEALRTYPQLGVYFHASLRLTLSFAHFAHHYQEIRSLIRKLSKEGLLAPDPLMLLALPE